ncbi:MAG: hypothetical protein KDK50_01050 [Chlamydiia bacterium]|nr:hypothetical protein [Chlamydiia bacterium]MCP5491949.1 hypothetical protein [Chlamydiales bacterium]
MATPINSTAPQTSQKHTGHDNRLTPSNNVLSLISKIALPILGVTLSSVGLMWSLKETRSNGAFVDLSQILTGSSIEAVHFLGHLTLPHFRLFYYAYMGLSLGFSAILISSVARLVQAFKDGSELEREDKKATDNWVTATVCCGIVAIGVFAKVLKTAQVQMNNAFPIMKAATTNAKHAIK